MSVTRRHLWDQASSTRLAWVPADWLAEGPRPQGVTIGRHGRLRSATPLRRCRQSCCVRGVRASSGDLRARKTAIVSRAGACDGSVPKRTGHEQRSLVTTRLSGAYPHTAWAKRGAVLSAGSKFKTAGSLPANRSSRLEDCTARNYRNSKVGRRLAWFTAWPTNSSRKWDQGRAGGLAALTKFPRRTRGRPRGSYWAPPHRRVALGNKDRRSPATRGHDSHEVTVLVVRAARGHGPARQVGHSKCSLSADADAQKKSGGFRRLAAAVERIS